MNRKIRVLHVLKSSVYSGAENIAITIIRHLDERFESRYLATKGEIEDILKRENIQCFLLDTYSRRNILRVVSHYAPDIIHAHDFTATVFCASLNGPFRVISHLHYDPPWTHRWNLRTLVYLCLKNRISKVLTVSSEMFQNMIFAEDFIEKLEILKNPLDIETIREKSQVKPETTDMASDIIFVGRFVEQKNPQRFIQLVSKLQERVSNNIQCKMLGHGVLFEECRQLAGSLRVQDSVQFLGFQDNPYAYIKQASLLCMTSRWEGYGLVVAEANVLGVPVLSTRTSGTSEILGEQAWEICDRDEDFIEKMVELLKKETRYEEQMKVSMQRANKFQTIEEYMQKIYSIYLNGVENK